MTEPAAIFDCGGVLTTSVRECLVGFEQATGLSGGDLGRVLLGPGQDGGESSFSKLERGRLSEAEFWRTLPDELERGLGLRINLPADLEEKRRMLWGALRPNERMLTVARAIAQRYPTALLTNGVREWSHLRDLCCPELFDVVVDSCEVGLRKPEPDIYQLVCERLGVRPEDAVFVDDLPANVEAARSAGMTGVLFETTEDTIRELGQHFPLAFPAGQ